MKLKYIIAILLITAYSSCSTVKTVPPGESHLIENKIIVENRALKSSELAPFIRQHPNSSLIPGWNPFVSIYNWGGERDRGIYRLFKRIGQPPVILDTFLVKRSITNIDNRLTSLGFYNNQVRDSIVISNKKSRVFYIVNPGKSFIIDSISYKIDNPVIDSIVKNHIHRSVIRKGSILSENSLERESNRITAILRNNGFYSFSNNFFFFEADTISFGGKANLYIKIKNYTRNESPADAREHNKYKIRDITIYPDHDPSILFSQSDVEYDTLNHKNFTLLSRGDRTIRTSVIDKMNLIKRGDLYSERTATISYDRLVALRFFSGVNLQFDQVIGEDTEDGYKQVDCQIRLTPSKSQGYKINLEASSNSNDLYGISPAISYYHKNLFKGGEWFSLGFMGNFQFKINDPTKSTEFGISTGLSLPTFLFAKDSRFKHYVPRTDINIRYSYQDRPEFTRNLISLNYGYTWRMGERLFYTINPLQLNIIKLYNLNPGFYESLKDPFLKYSYRNHFDLGMGSIIYYTTDASAIPKKSFFYIRLANDLAGNLISLFNSSLSRDTTGARLIWNTPYAQYFRTDLTLGYTKVISPSQSWANRVNIGVGYAYGNSNVLPFEKLFYAGGANSMRGWQARSLGPGSSAIDSTFSIPNQTGDLKLEINSEYRFKLFWRMEGALFADIGNIWTLKSEIGREGGLFKIKDFYKSIACNWGVGTRLNLEFVILRLDLGMVLREPHLKQWIGPKDWFKKNTYAIQFGVGYPF